MTASELAAQLDARKHASGWLARCPAHEDRTPSMTIAAGDDGRVLLKCHAGCSFTEVVQALGIKQADLFPGNARAPKARIRSPAAPTASKTPRPIFDHLWWLAKFEAIATGVRFPSLVRELGIPHAPMLDLGFRRMRHKTHYAIPMYDADGMCGIQFRGTDGGKWLLAGSTCALFIPRSYREGPLIVCEGASDTASMLSIGFDAVGRFNSSQNPQFLVDWMAPQDRRDVVLVVDADPAGERGARMVAKALRYVTNSVRMVMPGRWADAREWVRRVPAPLIRSAIMAARRL